MKNITVVLQLEKSILYNPMCPFPFLCMNTAQPHFDSYVYTDLLAVQFIQLMTLVLLLYRLS